MSDAGLLSLRRSVLHVHFQVRRSRNGARPIRDRGDKVERTPRIVSGASGHMFLHHV